MIKSLTIAIASFLFFTNNASAQTIGQQIDKLAKDPATAERAAKADVYIIGKKISNDSTAATYRKPDAVATKKKKRQCKKN